MIYWYFIKTPCFYFLVHQGGDSISFYFSLIFMNFFHALFIGVLALDKAFLGVSLFYYLGPVGVFCMLLNVFLSLLHFSVHHATSSLTFVLATVLGIVSFLLGLFSEECSFGIDFNYKWIQYTLLCVFLYFLYILGWEII